jgi:amidase
MPIHTFTPAHYHTTLGPHEPVLHIADGDTVETTTVDASGRDASGEVITAGGNPQTGPFFVEGAEPGDTLALELHRIWPNRDYGWSGSIVAANVVDPWDAWKLPDGARAEWKIDHQAGTATLVAPDTRLGALTIPLDPMLGCFGVAPSGRQAISTATSAQHGGNMDYRGFKAGTTVYFPVFEPGALVHVGDGHAVQGDGEIVGTGIEISMDVRFTVRVLKGKRRRWPGGEDAEFLFTVGNARPLDQALQHATSEMLRVLEAEHGLDTLAASLLLGQCVRYEIGNVFDPAYTVVCKIAKAILADVARSR